MISLVTITWSNEDNYGIEKTALFKSFKKFNPNHNFFHFHFNRGHYHELESEFNNKFGLESEYILYKIHMLNEKLKEINSDYIIFCDANDVVCLNSIDNLLNIFDLNENIIVGAEKNQWPTEDRKKNWESLGFQNYKEFDSKNESYLNSGVVFAKKENFIKMLENMKENILSKNIKDFRNDQAVYTWYYTGGFEPKIKLDYSNIFALNTFKRNKEDFYLNKNGKITCKSNGINPCFVHDNGWNHGSPKFINNFELKRLYSESYAHLKNISRNEPIPESHQKYLFKLKNEFNFNPKTIWDIGACVLHWTTIAKKVWPDSEYVLFEAMEESEELFSETDYKYFIEVLSDEDEKEVTFFKNVTFPGGNSYYMENPEHSSMAECLFSNPQNQFKRKTKTLDSIQRKHNLQYPDLVKIDVQGCEIDILKGAKNILNNIKHLIVELQHVEYNIGAQLCEKSVPFIESLGFKLVTPKFSLSSPADADYHFIKI